MAASRNALKSLGETLLDGIERIKDASKCVDDADPERLGEALNEIMRVLRKTDEAGRELSSHKISLPGVAVDHIDQDRGNDLKVLTADAFQLQIRREHDARTWVSDCETFKKQLGKELDGMQ